jgi:DNA modification methylase
MTRGSVTRFNCWEPILFYACKNTSRAHDVFDFPTSIHFGGAGSGIADPHPCPKPAALWSELLSCYTEEGDTVYDAFLGSGTCLVAAEEASRRCVAMEHSPHYIDIALTRYSRATDKEPRRVE